MGHVAIATEFSHDNIEGKNGAEGPDSDYSAEMYYMPHCTVWKVRASLREHSQHWGRLIEKCPFRFFQIKAVKVTNGCFCQQRSDILLCSAERLILIAGAAE